MNPLKDFPRFINALGAAVPFIGTILTTVALVLGITLGTSESAGGNAGSSNVTAGREEQPKTEDPVEVAPDELAPMPAPADIAPDPVPAPDPEDKPFPAPAPAPSEAPAPAPAPSELPEPEIKLPTAPEPAPIELGEGTVVGGVNDTTAFELPVTLELQPGDRITAEGVNVQLNTKERELRVTTKTQTAPGRYPFRINRGGRVIGNGSVVVSKPVQTPRKIVKLGNVELAPNHWTDWNLPRNFDFGSRQEIVVFDNTSGRIVGDVVGGLYNGQLQVAANRDAQIGAYLVGMYVDGKAAAYGVVNVVPKPVELPAAEVRVGSSFGLDLPDTVFINDTSTAGVYVSGTDTPADGLQLWYDKDERKLNVTALENAKPGTYDFYLYTGKYFIGKGTVTVVAADIAPGRIDLDELREGRLNATWTVAPEYQLPNRRNDASGDFRPSWYPHAATEMRNTGYLTPGSEYFTRTGICSSGFFVTIDGRPFMLTAGHCGKPGDPIFMNTVYGQRQVGTFIPEGHFLIDKDPSEYFDPEYDFALVALNDFGASLVHPAVGGQFELSGYIDARSLRNQDVVCRIGRTRGYSCGRYLNHMNSEIFRVSNISSQGDSGGPLFAIIDGKYYAVGMTSLGPVQGEYLGAQNVYGPIKHFNATLYGGLRAGN